jgi:tetratricopeptide (TPR) repeat protein
MSGEVASTLLPNLSLPDWTVTLVTVLVVLGFVLAVMLAWAFDIGPGGVHRTQPADTAAAATGEPGAADPERVTASKGETGPSARPTPNGNRSTAVRCSMWLPPTRRHMTITFAAAENHLDLHPDDARAMYLGAGSLAAIGELEKARAWVERALDTDRNETAVLYNVACVYSMMGDVERAIDLLTEAIDNGFGYRAWLENDNQLEALRGDDRFQALLNRLD